MDKLISIFFLLVFISYSATGRDSITGDEKVNLPARGSSIIVATVPNNPLYNLYKQYILKAYTDIGYKVSFVEYSLGKAVVEGNKGNIDALIIRASDIENELSNFRRVPTIIAKGQLVLYCHKEVICSEEVLDEPRNLIGIVSGTNITSGFMKNKNASVYQVEEAVNVGMMLEKNRFDYILTIDEDNFGNYSSLTQENYKRVILKNIIGYHYVYKNIAGIIPELTISLANAISEIGPPKLQ